jgi:beta-galactosidase
MKDGSIAVTEEISTTGDAAAINLTADRTSLAADRRDVAHITVAIHDAQGRVVPSADYAIAFTVEGPATLLGLDNGNPLDHDSYKLLTRRAFHGLCLAVVQSTAKSGQILVAASSPGLQSATVTLIAN